MLPNIRDYDALYRQFRWQIPAQYNIGVDVCDKWAAADPGRLAILHMRTDGRAEEITFGWLRETSNRLANTLVAHGIKRGDRVAVLLPQAPEVAASHVAIYKAGCCGIADRDPVRPRRARLPPAEFRRACVDHQRAGACQARGGSCRGSERGARALGRRS